MGNANSITSLKSKNINKTKKEKVESRNEEISVSSSQSLFKNINNLIPNKTLFPKLNTTSKNEIHTSSKQLYRRNSIRNEEIKLWPAFETPGTQTDRGTLNILFSETEQHTKKNSLAKTRWTHISVRDCNCIQRIFKLALYRIYCTHNRMHDLFAMIHFVGLLFYRFLNSTFY